MAELHTLNCVECGVAASDLETTGWRAYLDDDVDPEVVVFCSVCALREFGEFRENGQFGGLP